MTPEYNKAVISIVELIVANNPAGTARALKKLGYDIGNYVPEGDLKTALMQLEKTNPKIFWNTLRDIEWNHGINNWTNDPKYQQPLIDSISKGTGSPVAKGGFWGALVDIGMQLFQGQQQPPPVPVQPSTPWGTYFITAFVAVVIVVVLWFGIKALK